MKKNRIFPLAIIIGCLNVFANGLLVLFNSQLPNVFSTILSIFFVVNAFIALIIAYQAYHLLEKERMTEKTSEDKSKKELKKEAKTAKELEKKLESDTQKEIKTEETNG